MNNWPEMMVKRVAASYCGLSVETFEREIAAGRLPMGVHFGDDDDGDDCSPEGPAFECAGYNDGTGFYCPLWGSEECDWECPEGGMG